MSHDTRRFLVVGHPRSGSTWLMHRISMAVHAFTPNVRHEELFNVYECRFNACVLGLDASSEVAMLEGFYALATRRFAGFKTIPSFHREWASIISVPDVQLITIHRKDFLSCLASTLVSEQNFQWDRPVRDQLEGSPLLFSELYQDRRRLEIQLGELLNRLLFDYRSIERLNRRRDTIAMTAEWLAGSTPSSEKVDAYFEQPVPLSGFQEPTDYRECFRDPELFRAAVASLLHRFVQYDTMVPAPVASFLAET